MTKSYKFPSQDKIAELLTKDDDNRYLKEKKIVKHVAIIFDNGTFRDDELIGLIITAIKNAEREAKQEFPKSLVNTTVLTLKQALVLSVSIKE